jgi:ligand-binding sensor domain-containing protein
VDIAVDADNRKWFCPNPHFGSGATAFDDSAWTTWTTANSGLAGDTVRRCFADSLGNTWFLTDRGISRKNGTLWTTYPYGAGGAPDSTVGTVASDGKAVWFGTSNGLVRFEDGEWKTFTTADGLSGNKVTALAPDGAGRLWIGVDSGICRYDRAGFFRYPEKDRLLSGIIEDIAEDEDGSMWFATHGGLTHFDGVEWRTYTVEDGLNFDAVNFLDRDRTGALLVGTGSRLYRMGPGGLEPCGKEMIEPGFQSGWTRTNKGWLAAGGDTGICAYHIASGTAFRLPAPEPGIPLGWQILFEDRDTFWMQSMDGLIRFDGGRFTRFRTEGLPFNASRILDGVVDHHNVKWFISQGFLSRYDGKAWSFFSLDSLSVMASRLAVDPEDRVWIQGDFNIVSDQTHRYGLLSFDGAKWEKHICDLPGTDRFSGWEMVVDHSGAKWMVDSYRLLRYADGKWTEIPAADIAGPGVILDDIAIDRNNVLWVGASKGVYTFDGAAWTRFYDRPEFPYGKDMGCADITIDSRGGLWMDGYRRRGDAWTRGLLWTASPRWTWTAGIASGREPETAES